MCIFVSKRQASRKSHILTLEKATILVQDLEANSTAGYFNCIIRSHILINQREVVVVKRFFYLLQHKVQTVGNQGIPVISSSSRRRNRFGDMSQSQKILVLCPYHKLSSKQDKDTRDDNRRYGKRK